MSDWYVGQRVVCINDDENFVQPLRSSQYFYSGTLDGLTVGQVYTVSRVYLSDPDEIIALELEEIVRAQHGWCHEPGFAAMRFKPLDDTAESIEWARQICRDVEAKDTIPTIEREVAEALGHLFAGRE